MIGRGVRLKKGDVVWLTREGLSFLGRARSRLGVVVDRNFGTWLRLKVRRDGLKGATWYSGLFWRKASNREVLRYARGRPGLKSRKGAGW